MTVQGAEAGKVEEGLRYGPPGDRAVHLCIDMQRLFDKGSEWAVDWMRQVLPNVCQVVEMFPARTIFTRFIPPESLDDAPGAWRRYYEKWPQMLRQNLDSDWLRLLPELEIHLPGAQVFDKPVYSPWMDGRLHPMLQQDRIDTLILTGGETDICLLAAVIGAVDLDTGSSSCPMPSAHRRTTPMTRRWRCMPNASASRSR